MQTTPTTVINIKHVKSLPPNYIYCGRGSDYGNPFSHLGYSLAKWKVASREQAINFHRDWVSVQPDLIARIRKELKGKVLGCYCKPESCHCDTLAFVADGGEL